jgi:hypothetical protein
VHGKNKLLSNSCMYNGVGMLDKVITTMTVKRFDIITNLAEDM